MRSTAQQTIQMIDKANAWDYKLNPSECTVADTFLHIFRAIVEQASNSLSGEQHSFHVSDSPMQDAERSIDRLIRIIRDYTDEQLAERVVYPWCGGEITISGAIELILFHTFGHLAQIRERVGVLMRSS